MQSGGATTQFNIGTLLNIRKRKYYHNRKELLNILMTSLLRVIKRCFDSGRDEL